MAIQKRTRAAGAVSARVVPTLPGGDPIHMHGECLLLQGLVAAYHRGLKQTRTKYQRVVLQKALQRVQAELRLARRNHPRLEAA